MRLAVPDAPIQRELIERTLVQQDKNGQVELKQASIFDRSEPIAILGEAGMGKTELLTWIGETPGYVYCTARQLIFRHDPRSILGNGEVIVIDALDEVSAKNEGDAIGEVLRQLGVLSYPRFILACRVADWRSATGSEAIREQYGVAPLALHLAPLSEEEIIVFLSRKLGATTAQSVVKHFNERGLHGLLGNPQTLDLIARVAANGHLPVNRGELFEQAAEILRQEHRLEKANEQISSVSGLGAAGAAFAAMILTGSEGIVRSTPSNALPGELLLSELATLPSGDGIPAMLRTRLFKADRADRFGYLHRRIGEYLGARWLSNLADTPRKRRRMLSIFQRSKMIPASLRGMHAWLAQDPALTSAVIWADPAGLIEYGDIDQLTTPHVRELLSSLHQLSDLNPYLPALESSSLRGLIRNDLVDSILQWVATRSTPYRFRILLLNALKESDRVQRAVERLKSLVLDATEVFAIRSEAGAAISPQLTSDEWQEVLQTLIAFQDVASLRLAIELTQSVNYEFLDDAMLAQLVVAYSKRKDTVFGVLWRLQRDLPHSRLEGVLNALCNEIDLAGASPQPVKTADNNLTYFAYHLISRRVTSGEVDRQILWHWLQPFDLQYTYRRDVMDRFNGLISSNHSLRRSVQRLVLLDLPGADKLWRRLLKLQSKSPAFTPSESDLLELLSALDPADRADMRWREIVMLSLHDEVQGHELRERAKDFAAHRMDLLSWIDRLPTPRSMKREKARVRKQLKRRASKSSKFAEHRTSYTLRIDDMRAGDHGALVDPAKAYLKAFSDIGDDAAPHERVAEWLGDELGFAAHLGFERYLTQHPPEVTATDISMALAQREHFPSEYILSAALAERLRTGFGFKDLPDERLLAGLLACLETVVEETGIEGLEEALETELQNRGKWEDAMRLYFEPQLEGNIGSIFGLHELMFNGRNEELATKLALEWLQRFPHLQADSEMMLIKRMLHSRLDAQLSPIAALRIELGDERRRNWDAVGLLVDFDRTIGRLKLAPIEPKLLWNLRDLIEERHGNQAVRNLDSRLLHWIISIFRSFWAMAAPPNDVMHGNMNSWDASDFIVQLIRKLGNDHSDNAATAMNRLLSGPKDGYTYMLKVAAAEQARMRAESSYTPWTLKAVNAALLNRPPAAIEDVQAVMLEEIDIVQKKITSDDVESWRGFFDPGMVPFEEERCRDHLLGLMRQGSEGITLTPETHINDDKEVDITCSVSSLRLPIEVKGQWNRDLWTGADAQLDKLYTGDWQAGGYGIYLVLWFGKVTKQNKRLKSRGRGKPLPETAAELQRLLTLESIAAKEGRVAIVVLDLTRTQTHFLTPSV